ncbi:DNA mismatch repair protein Mlh1 [Phymastichus coffea]|uniref:DNA mismatch repair protein Mlh1 n=1 Tax=Phymastichus coffea TaxID=108790 RepID=UPI00273C79E9|nr:DNA mismatch repair protein Mlh1 [Phymastichus coffea]
MSVETPGKIRKLDEVVVNRIAAGEIIQRPANALKELIENSLDAKSTNIQVSVKEGGLKLLQIQDNGTGIRKEDMNIVCERFTTSKLQNFDDLKAISTFGFRGEALASISHVAQLTITTKTASEKCAYKAIYVDGKPKASPVPTAGNQGTIITVENLFYNVATRRKALSSHSEEFSRISEVVTKYAVHNPNVGFTLKKYGQSSTDVRTPHSSTTVNNIRTLYGNCIARELLEIELDDKTYHFKLHAFVTNANYSNKKMTLLLFINNRLVDSSAIKRTIEDLYTVYLPKKGHPWCYLSLEIDPQNVDVNVHPTKHEVRFLHEDIIVEKIKIALDEKLAANNASRTFYISTKLPKLDLTQEAISETQNDAEKDKTKKVYPKHMIRTSSTDQKLDKFNFIHEIVDKDDARTDRIIQNLENTKKLLRPEKLLFNDNTSALENEGIGIFRTASDLITSKKTNKPNPAVEILEQDKLELSVIQNVKCARNEIENVSEPSKNVSKTKSSDQANIDVRTPENNHSCSKKVTKENAENENAIPECRPLVEFKSYSVNEIQVETKLLSILTLRKEVEDTYHAVLRKILSELIFVGCVNETFALIQSGTKLYITNTRELVEELFYEIMLYDFANYGVIKFSEPLQIKDLAVLGLDCEEAGWTEEIGEKEELAERVQELLLEKADMLRQYFSIYIDKKGQLKSLPILLENYFPNPAELPLYLLRLSTEVDWSKEKPCFHDICRETARFYSKIDTTNDSWQHTTEHILYSAIKESLLPPQHFAHDSSILEIANLPDLYRVFERC